METHRQRHDYARPATSKPASTKRGLERTGQVLSCLIVCWLLWGAPRAFCQSEDSTEYEIKLGFLLNFAQFVQWPADAFADAKAPLRVCVAGENPFQGDLEHSLGDRKVGNHPIEIRRLKPGDNPRACHIIFVRASEKKATGRILTGLNGSSTLSVGEAKGFAEHGGIINLTLEENKLRFEVNIDAATQTRLKISSKLLALAKIVKD